jgi:hypothetical protein
MITLAHLQLNFAMNNSNGPQGMPAMAVAALVAYLQMLAMMLGT